VEIPLPKDDLVLVRVHAASVTFSNLLMVTGRPFPLRLAFGGLLKPRIRILGSDIAGRVVAVGNSVKQFNPGDKVFGYLARCGYGGYAEYVCAPENALGFKPANLSFDQAAAVPEAALVALQAVQDDGQIKPGHKVLVYGASGGIGTFAVQIAHALGAHVTGVCSAKNLEMVRSIGADRVVDHEKEDFAKNGERYDLIVGAAGYRSIRDYERALTPRGIYVATGGSWTQVFQAAALGRRMSTRGGRRLGILVMNPNYDFAFLRELIESGRVRPVIDSCYALSEAAEAFEHYGKRHARGKVVIRVE
jgi:NADPH:quinone reductase-like Zn-dependent oxidoreductase